MAFYPDISHWKPVSDWSLIQKNCPFIISKATQGTNFIDSYLKTFVTNCEKHKIPYWLYVFLDKGNEKAQAEFMVKVCKPLVGPYFRGYVLDVEKGNTAAGVKAALDYIETQSAKTMIYTMFAQYSIYSAVIAKRGENCAWWEARYGQNTGRYSMPCHGGVDLHQFTSKGICPGLGSDTDLNMLTGRLPESWFTDAAAPDPKTEEEEMEGLAKEKGDSKIYYYNIASKIMFHVPNPDALTLLKEEYKRKNGKDIQFIAADKFATLKALIKGKSI